MDITTVCEEQDPQSLPAAGSSLSPEMMTEDFPDNTDSVMLKLLKFCQEKDELKAKLEKLKQDTTTVREEQDADVCEERDSRSLPAAMSSFSPGMKTEDPPDKTEASAILKLLKIRQEKDEMDSKMDERKQLLRSLEHRIKELNNIVEDLTDLYERVAIFLEDEYFNPLAEEAERARQEGLQKDAEIKRLKEETARLLESKQELLREVERYTPYRDIMGRAANMSKFENADQLADHVEHLLVIRDELIQKDNEKQEKMDQMRKQLLMVEEQHRLMRLQKSARLAQLQAELVEASSEALKWERKWNHIQETAAKKTLLLGQIKMATLNIYEKTEDKEVDINDTEKQLDKIKEFIKDHVDIVKRYKTEQSTGPKTKKKKGKAKMRKLRKRP